MNWCFNEKVNTMLYKIEQNKIILLDSISLKETIIPLKEPVGGRVWRLTLNDDATKIAIRRGRNASPRYSALIVDLNSGERLTPDISSDYLDFQWLDCDSLIYSNGNTLLKYDLTTQKSFQLCKFNRIRYSPIGMSISPDKTKVAFVRFKADNTKLCIFNLETNELTQFKNSILDYSWDGSKHIIFNYLKGIRVLDVDSGEVKTLTTGIKAILKKNNKLEDDRIDELNKLLNANSPSQAIVGTLATEERYYFAINISVWETAREFTRRIAVISVLRDLSDLKFHFWSSKGFFEYHLFRNENMIGVKRKSNTMTKEIVDEGWHYLINDEIKPELRVQLDKFHIVSNSQEAT